MDLTQAVLQIIKNTGGDTSPSALAKTINTLSMDTVMGYREMAESAIASVLVHIVRMGPMPDLTPTVLKSMQTRENIVDGEIKLSMVK